MQLSRMILVLGLFFLPAKILSAKNYYIKTGGNDALSGNSIANAWSSISKVNSIRYYAGDSILFQGGSTFNGSLYLDSQSKGAINKTIFIGSYGGSKAAIYAGNSDGFYAYNNSGIEINRIDFKGSGASTNKGVGIRFFMDINGNINLKNITIKNTIVSGFSEAGIQFGSWPTDGSRSGYKGVLLDGCEVYQNGKNGINFYGYYSISDTFFSHKNIHIIHCTAHHNLGFAGLKTPNGNGIIVGQADSCLVEYCEAWENGKNCDNSAGPAAIWAWDSKHVTIQFCYAHHNRSSGGDGDGFDLDGGVQYSVMQYNYSHDNDGPGFLIAQYGGARKMKNLVVRYNVSERDGKGLSAMIWSGDPGTAVTASNIDFYNNTIYTDTTGNFANGAITVYNNYGAMQSIRICNNIFISKNNANLVNVQPALDLSFINNLYFDNAQGYRFLYGGSTYTSFTAWQVATGQEVYKSNSTGFHLDPKLLNAGKGGTITTADSLISLSAYRLKSSSQIIGKGIKIDGLQRWNSPLKDFYADTVSTSGKFTLGAHDPAIPKAQFAVNNSCIGQSNSFNSSGSKGLLWLWKFGDSTFSTLKNPVHTYSKPGNYDVVLTITEKFGYVDSIKKTVTVFNKPIANFNAQNICFGDSVLFVNTSSNSTSHSWYFGDSDSSNNSSATHLYAKSGTYKVTLIAYRQNLCLDSVSKYIKVYPEWKISLHIAPVCFGQKTIFDAPDSAVKTSWFYGDGDSSMFLSATHIYKYPGKYNVLAVVENVHGCKDTSSDSTQIYALPKNGFTAQAKCVGDSLQIKNSGSPLDNHFWYLSTGDSFHTFIPHYKTRQSGTLGIIQRVENKYHCSVSSSGNVNISALPTASFSYIINKLNVSFKATDTVFKKYIWHFDDGDSAIGFYTTHTFKDTGSFKVRLAVLNASDCAQFHDTLIRLKTLSNISFAPSNIYAITVYPNPGNGKITVQFDAISTLPVQICLMTPTGQIVSKMLSVNAANSAHTITFNTDKLNLQPGCYFIVVSSADCTKSIAFIKD